MAVLQPVAKPVRSGCMTSAISMPLIKVTAPGQNQDPLVADRHGPALGAVARRGEGLEIGGRLSRGVEGEEDPRSSATPVNPVPRITSTS